MRTPPTRFQPRRRPRCPVLFPLCVAAALADPTHRCLPYHGDIRALHYSLREGRRLCPSGRNEGRDVSGHRCEHIV